MYIFQTDVLLDKWMKRVKVHDILLLPSLHTVAESEEMPHSLSPLVLAQHSEESKLSLSPSLCASLVRPGGWESLPGSQLWVCN